MIWLKYDHGYYSLWEGEDPPKGFSKENKIKCSLFETYTKEQAERFFKIKLDTPQIRKVNFKIMLDNEVINI